MNFFTFVSRLKNSNMQQHFWLLLIFLASSLVNLNAQSPCSSEMHRQFDFWVGNWVVYHATADTVVGHNKIEKILNGCVVQENWKGATGFAGKSINTFSTIDSTWNQVWVDVSGAIYHFKGKIVDQAMVMEGTTANNNQTILFEMSYTPDKNNGNVRQLWKQSIDNGETWAVIFDGIYKKQKD